MFFFKRFLSGITWLPFFQDLFDFLKKLLKYNASIHTKKDPAKFEFTIQRQCHVIEKGLSMRAPHFRFGIQNAESLSHNLLIYHKLYGEKNPNFIKYPQATLFAYLNYAKKNGWDSKIIQDNLSNLPPCDAKFIKGTFILHSSDIQDSYVFFDRFVKSRHSIRYFHKQVPSQDILNKALQLAQQTPSACNRQCWKVHQFSKTECTRLLKWQEGARGFENEPTVAFLVTANLKAFLSYEPFQAYIDGGMYAMSLIYALHSVGLGTIPLSCGFHQKKLNRLYKEFCIPQNEIPIEIIATGLLPNELNVAISERKIISEVVTIHE